MPQIHITEQLYKAAERRAAESGCSTVDEYVAKVVSHDLGEAAENLDHLFTPERLAHIDKANSEIEAGKYFTSEEVDTELAKRRAEWNRNNPR